MNLTLSLFIYLIGGAKIEQHVTLPEKLFCSLSKEQLEILTDEMIREIRLELFQSFNHFIDADTKHYESADWQGTVILFDGEEYPVNYKVTNEYGKIIKYHEKRMINNKLVILTEEP